MPFPGVLGLLGAAAASVLAAIGGQPLASALAGIAFVLRVIWLVVYLRISAPINRVLTAAADRNETLTNARALQQSWDRVINLRVVLQGMAVVALSASLIA